MEQRVQSILSQMTLDEKLNYISGTGFPSPLGVFNIKAISRLGLPEIFGSDGTIGIVGQAFERSMNKLQLDHLDLYLIHQPYGDVYGAWRPMEELHLVGKIKAIGVSNFYPDRIVDFVIHNKITPAVNQIETHPLSISRPKPRSCFKRTMCRLKPGDRLPKAKTTCSTNEVLHSVGAKHGKSVAQVVLRWRHSAGLWLSLIRAQRAHG